jgi:myo-inositol 2-dehydrogenase/D-chiro-inositol 1-dehydrogenase
MIEAADKAGVRLCVAFMHRHFEEVTLARDLLAAGALGRILHVRQRNATSGADWAAWFYQRANVGGGALMRLGIHGIDLVRHLAGDIVAVQGTTATMVATRQLADGTTVHPDNEDLVLATYRLASGALATHEVSYAEAAGTDRFRMELYGESGTAWLRTERGRLAVWAPAHTGRAEWTAPPVGPDDPARRQHAHFLAVVRGEQPDDGSARDGLASVLVAEAVYRSAESRRWESVRWPQA